MVAQDKSLEIAFFDGLAATAVYDVFTPATNERIVGACLDFAGLKGPARLLDLGCGSGVFTNILARRGFEAIGVDISEAMIKRAKQTYPRLAFEVGDAERLGFANETFDGVLLSGLIHHFPDPSACLSEVHRILKQDAPFAAFDPNRQNPFMYLYRDPSSPFYSNKGVSPNERPVLPRQLEHQLRTAGFESIRLKFLSKLSYRYVASPLMRLILPIYNGIDRVAFSPELLASRRAFIISTGRRPKSRP